LRRLPLIVKEAMMSHSPNKPIVQFCHMDAYAPPFVIFLPKFLEIFDELTLYLSQQF
jgi:hypothetical protein